MKKKLVVLFLGIIMALSPSIFADDSGVAMYRVYNPNSGEHFYTRVVSEKDYLVKVGWRYEGIGWVAPTSGDNVYRLYNPNSGDHHYTLNASEKDYLVKVGWRYEGIGWQSASTSAVPLYRLYNPNARTGTHHYTTNKSESDGLSQIGWRYEGVAWYGISGGVSSSNSGGQSTVAPRQVDIDITTEGGGEGILKGSYRLLYSNKVFEQLPSTYQVPLLEFSADMILNGNKSANADYGMQFIVAGNGAASGQIGLDIGYQAGTSSEFAQGRFAVKTVNFPANSGTFGEQYYSVNTNANMNGSARITVQYFRGNYGEYVVTKLNGTIIGSYETKLTTSNAYILHAQVNDSQGQANLQLKNIQVKKNGVDITWQGAPSLHGTSSSGITQTEFSLVANTSNWLIQGAYYAN